MRSPTVFCRSQRHKLQFCVCSFSFALEVVLLVVLAALGYLFFGVILAQVNYHTDNNEAAVVDFQISRAGFIVEAILLERQHLAARASTGLKGRMHARDFDESSAPQRKMKTSSRFGNQENPHDGRVKRKTRVARDYDESSVTQRKMKTSSRFGNQENPHDGRVKRKTRVAIILPFRNRPKQLRVFIPEIQAFLAKQNIEYRIVAIEQLGTAKFNKGSVLNIGLVEAFRSVPTDHFDCVVIHDVDLVPIVSNNSYDCREQPDVGAVQLSSAIEMYGWDLPLNGPGGVNMVQSKVMLKANGYSNRFFGWGGEDNDFEKRLKAIGVTMIQRNKASGRYRNIKEDHFRSPGKAINRCILLRYTNQSRVHEGISSVRYRLQKRMESKTYTYVGVKLWHMEDPELVTVHWNKQPIIDHIKLWVDHILGRPAC